MNFDGIDPGWLWLIGGVVLLIAEVIAPGWSHCCLASAPFRSSHCSRSTPCSQ